MAIMTGSIVIYLATAFYFTSVLADSIDWNIVDTSSKAELCVNAKCVLKQGQNVQIVATWVFYSQATDPRLVVKDVNNILYSKSNLMFFFVCPLPGPKFALTLKTDSCSYTLKNGNYTLRPNALNVPNITGNQETGHITVSARYYKNGTAIEPDNYTGADVIVNK